MINLNRKYVLQRVDLETGIYRILSDEKGNSQNELLEELVKYSLRIKEYDVELKVDKGNLSKKLKSLETDGVILRNWKKMTDRNQDSYSYYIKKDLPTFEYIMGHLAKDIGTAMDFSIHNQRIWRISNIASLAIYKIASVNISNLNRCFFAYPPFF
jgi:hypothetical protein